MGSTPESRVEFQIQYELELTWMEEVLTVACTFMPLIRFFSLEMQHTALQLAQGMVELGFDAVVACT